MDVLKLLKFMSIVLFIFGVTLLVIFDIFSKPIPSSEFLLYKDQIVKFEGGIYNKSLTRTAKYRYLICDRTGCFYLISNKEIECKYIIGKAQVKEYWGNLYLFLKDIIVCR